MALVRHRVQPPVAALIWRLLSASCANRHVFVSVLMHAKLLRFCPEHVVCCVTLYLRLHYVVVLAMQ